ncbi:MAG: hypothetical protein WCC94_04140, partial [Candidatus Bathyarchaeia archaeon]
MQERADYPEATHRLPFPRSYGFTGDQDEHCGNVFQRAIVLDALLDALQRGKDVDEAYVRADVRTLVDMRYGNLGWKYIPTVPELAPDADDLALVTQVLVKSECREIWTLCGKAIDTVSRSAYPDGSFETWIVDDFDDSKEMKRMSRYVREKWGTGPDIEVVANLLYSLLLLDRARFQDWVLRGSEWVCQQQHPDGFWNTTWYSSKYWGVYMCTRLIASLIAEIGTMHRVACFLRKTMTREGGWGENSVTPLDTALGLLTSSCLAGYSGCELHIDAIVSSVQYLLRSQNLDGSWLGTDFLRFPYKSDTISTALCLKALLTCEKDYGDERDQHVTAHGSMRWKAWGDTNKVKMGCTECASDS